MIRDDSAQRMTVVSTANARYFPGVLVTFHSLLRHLAPGWTVDFKLLTDGLDKRHDATLRDVLRRAGGEHTLEIIEVELGEYDRYRADYGGSKLAYARLLMPEMVRDDLVFYVDSDVVVQRDVSRLVPLPWPDDCLLYAVTDPKGPTFATDGMCCERVGISPTAPYFNSGVLWANLGEWRRRGIAGACRDFMRRFPDDVKWWDQSVLNAVLWRDWRPLDAAWNLLVDRTLGKFDLLPLRLVENVNVHYLGPEKPWLAFNAYHQYFDTYLAEIEELIPGAFLSYRPGLARELRRLWFFANRSYWTYGSACKQSLKALFKRS